MNVQIFCFCAFVNNLTNHRELLGFVFWFAANYQVLSIKFSWVICRTHLIAQLMWRDHPSKFKAKFYRFPAQGQLRNFWVVCPNLNCCLTPNLNCYCLLPAPSRLYLANQKHFAGATNLSHWCGQTTIKKKSAKTKKYKTTQFAFISHSFIETMVSSYRGTMRTRFVAEFSFFLCDGQTSGSTTSLFGRNVIFNEWVRDPDSSLDLLTHMNLTEGQTVHTAEDRQRWQPTCCYSSCVLLPWRSECNRDLP